MEVIMAKAAASKSRSRATVQTQGIKQIHLAINSNTSFDALVKVLREVLTVPELPGIKGCRPCLSGLDRFIIEDPAINRIR
jgi:hypothetical protein